MCSIFGWREWANGRGYPLTLTTEQHKGEALPVVSDPLFIITYR